MADSIILQGLGSYVPAKRLTNDDLAHVVETSDEWIRTRSGIRERRIAGPDENPSDMAAAAGRQALERAGLTPADVDLLIVGTMTPDLPFPSTACLVQNKLGLRPIPAFDVAAACSGFLYILEVGAAMVRAGPYRNALIIGADKMSSVLDWQDRKTCVLFGDGAGAAVLTRSGEQNVGVLGSVLRTDGGSVGLLLQPGGGSACPPTPESLGERKHFLKMNGKEVFKIAVREMEQVIRDLLAQHHLTAAQIAWVVPHQANIRILEALATRLEIPLDRFVINIDRYGNT